MSTPTFDDFVRFMERIEAGGDIEVHRVGPYGALVAVRPRRSGVTAGGIRWADRSDVREQMLLTGRCRNCVTGEHHLCRGWGIDRCPCYCQDILEEESGGSPVD